MVSGSQCGRRRRGRAGNGTTEATTTKKTKRGRVDRCREEDSSDESSVLQDPLPVEGALRRLSGIETPRLRLHPPRSGREKLSPSTSSRLRIDLEDLWVGFLPELLEGLEIPLEGPFSWRRNQQVALVPAIIDAGEAAGWEVYTRSDYTRVGCQMGHSVCIIGQWVGGDKERYMEKWTRSEVKALLLAFIRPDAPPVESEDESHLPLL